MNCPCHVQVFNQGLKSYRDLPLRLAEFGSCHRNEPSGSLHGIMRVRGFTQDDAHIFCTDEQIQPEVSQFIDMLHEVYMAPKVNAGTLVFIGDHGVAASPSDEGEGCCAYPQVFMTGIHS